MSQLPKPSGLPRFNFSSKPSTSNFINGSSKTTATTSKLVPKTVTGMYYNLTLFRKYQVSSSDVTLPFSCL